MASSFDLMTAPSDRKSRRTNPKIGHKNGRHRHKQASVRKSGRRSFPIHGCRPDLRSYGSYSCGWRSQLTATDAARSFHSAARCCEERSALGPSELRLVANNSGLLHGVNTKAHLYPCSGMSCAGNPCRMMVDAARCLAKPFAATTCGNFPCRCAVHCSLHDRRSSLHSVDAEPIVHPRSA